MLREDHAELLRFISTLDFKIFGGYITLQLGLGSWLAEHRPSVVEAQIGVAIIDGTLTIIAAALIYNNFRRRTEIVKTLRNVNEALFFNEKGAYLPGEPLLAPTVFRPWRWWYTGGIVIAYIGIILILFRGLSSTSEPSKEPIKVHLVE
jgi:hypothetical protein